jgi:hypothetical protein
MASPHVAADMLQSGGGDLTPSLFPHLDAAGLAAYLTVKLAEGYARAAAAVPALINPDKDAAAIMWAYSQAFRAVWLRLSSSPATVGVDGEASRTYLAVQIQNFKDQSDDYLARHLAFIPVPSGESSSNVIVTRVPTSFRY